MTNEQITTNCLKRMFRAVQLKYPCPELTDQPLWYTTKTWTTQREEAFRKWMRDYLKKNMRYASTESIESEISWFLLMWGWSTTDPS